MVLESSVNMAEIYSALPRSEFINSKQSCNLKFRGIGSHLCLFDDNLVHTFNKQNINEFYFLSSSIEANTQWATWLVIQCRIISENVNWTNVDIQCHMVQMHLCRRPLPKICMLGQSIGKKQNTQKWSLPLRITEAGKCCKNFPPNLLSLFLTITIWNSLESLFM